jgi:hypothetical protein
VRTGSPAPAAVDARNAFGGCREAARVAAKMDSADAESGDVVIHRAKVIQRTLLTQFVDSGDATRGYPEDSTDEANSLDK